MAIQLSKCVDCGQYPDASWMVKGGNTDDNIWTTCETCRDCWDKVIKKANAVEQAEQDASGYRYEF